MRAFGILIVLIPSLALARTGSVSEDELSLGGVLIGDSPSEVIANLGKPQREVESPDFLNLHYDYSHVRVSFSDDVVAGLYSDNPLGCTPMHLCPGDSLDKTRALYGPPIVADRESGTFYEYYGADSSCWLEVSVTGKRVASIRVECQP